MVFMTWSIDKYNVKHQVLNVDIDEDNDFWKKKLFGL